MNAAQVIEFIKELPADERSKVFEFARVASSPSQLSPEELGTLAERMISAGDTPEGDRLEEELVAGFYGRKTHA
jgi:hypothetical protein